MAKTKISEYSTTAGSNTDIDNINIDEGCSPANLNNAIRTLMAQLRDFQLGNQTSNQLSVAGGGTGLTSVGTSGNVLTSDGSAWVSATPTYVPTGGMLMWGTSSAPTGYLLCDGSAVSRSTYSALFSVLSTAYGSGDGSTTFNVPDLRNRFPVGAGTTYSANSSGGSADAVVVSHTHTATSSVTDPGHSHTIAMGYSLNPGSYSQPSPNDLGSTNSTSTSTTGISVSTTVASSGVSGTNANLPPYLGVYFIIKT